jgi:hypothetical protein
MGQPEGQPPHAGERLTREDVERLIDDHGGPEGLDLQGADLRRADLRGLDLHGALLLQANLRQARLGGAHLQGATLARANLEQADLRAADLRWTRLAYANLRDANLEGAEWGDYVLGEESKGEFGIAAFAYRTLRQRHTEAGMYDIAGEFHYREMEARRKLAWKGRRLPEALATYALRSLYGYGERPWRIVGWAAAVVFGLAIVHYLFGTVVAGFPEALYYSAVSFSGVGYARWGPEPLGWAGKFLGAGESFVGVFTMALFLVTFTRKMTR